MHDKYILSDSSHVSLFNRNQYFFAKVIAWWPSSQDNSGAHEKIGQPRLTFLSQGRQRIIQKTCLATKKHKNKGQRGLQSVTTPTILFARLALLVCSPAPRVKLCQSWIGNTWSECQVSFYQATEWHQKKCHTTALIACHSPLGLLGPWMSLNLYLKQTYFPKLLIISKFTSCCLLLSLR